MNEPNLKGWTFTPTGARMLAEFSKQLSGYLQQAHPADRLISPDFLDHYNADGTIKRHPAGDSFVRALRQALQRRGWPIWERGRLASIWRREAQEPPEHRRPRLHAGRDLGGGAAHLGHRGGRARGRHLGLRPDRGCAGHTGEVDDRHGDRARVPRPRHAHSLLQHARGAGLRLVDVSGARRLPLGHRARAGVRPSAPGLVHVVPGIQAGRRRLLRRLARPRRRGARPGSTSSGAATATTPRSTAGHGTAWARRRGPWPAGSAALRTATTAVTAPADRRLETFVRGTNNAVMHRRYDGTSWSGWTNVGGLTYTSPAASARRGTAIVDAFIRGTDNAIYHRYPKRNHVVARVELDRLATGRRDVGPGRDLQLDRADRRVRSGRRRGDLAQDVDDLMEPVDEHRWHRHVRPGGRLARHGQAGRVRARIVGPDPPALDQRCGLVELGLPRRIDDLRSRRRRADREQARSLGAGRGQRRPAQGLDLGHRLVRVERGLVQGPQAL